MWLGHNFHGSCDTPTTQLITSNKFIYARTRKSFLHKSALDIYNNLTKDVRMLNRNFTSSLFLALILGRSS